MRRGDWLVTTNWHSFGSQVQKGACLADTLSELIISCVTKKTSGALSMTIQYPHHSGHGPNVVSFLQPGANLREEIRGTSVKARPSSLFTQDWGPYLRRVKWLQEV